MTQEDLIKMSYVDFMAYLNETNRCPWWISSIRKLIQNTFIHSNSVILDVGCNTWYVGLEIYKILWCKVTGIDISENMVAAANQNVLSLQFDSQKITFETGDAQNLSFPNNSFDLVTSGGSTIFVPDIKKAISEYARVCKPWGFIGEINFFYTDYIPTQTIAEINDLLWINIQPWKIEYFKELYEGCWLEEFYIDTQPTYQPTAKELDNYCVKMIAQSSKLWSLSSDLQGTAVNKLRKYMSLFVENNKYLSSGLFIYRKVPEGMNKQISLFWY